MRFFSTVVVASFGALATANPLLPVLSSRDTSVTQSSSVIPSYTVLNNYCEAAGPNAVSQFVFLHILFASQARFGLHILSNLMAVLSCYSLLDTWI